MYFVAFRMRKRKLYCELCYSTPVKLVSLNCSSENLFYLVQYSTVILH